jgi:hypothetical protein
LGRLPSTGFGANVNTPRDTAARKSGESRASSGSVRLSDQGFQATSVDAEIPGRAQAPGVWRFGAARTGTRPGSTNDGTAQAGPDRCRTGAARIQPTIFEVRLADADARVLNLNGQVPTRTWRGDASTGSPGLSSPRSIPDPSLLPIACLGDGEGDREAVEGVLSGRRCRRVKNPSVTSLRFVPPPHACGAGRRHSVRFHSPLPAPIVRVCCLLRFMGWSAAV